MKSIKYILAAAALTSFASCQKEDFGSFSSDPDAVQIIAVVGNPTKTRVNPVGATKADRTTFTDGEQIKVSADSQEAVTYKLENGVWKPDQDTYLKWNTESMTFNAYYPVTYTGAADVTAESDQSDLTKIKLADYMKTENLDWDKSIGAVEFVMQRQTARVVISEIRWGNQYGSDMQICPDGLTLTDGVSGDISPYVDNGTYYALLMPGNEKVDETFIKITIWDGKTDDSKENLIVKGIPALEAGYSYECTLTIGKDKASIESITVEEWATGGILNDGEGLTEEHIPYTVTEVDYVKTYVVDSEAGLRAVNRIITSDVSELNSGIILAADITLTGENNWTPIGNRDNPYTGIFDGNSKTITGLHINNGSAGYQGLIGYLSNGTVKDLTLADSMITGKATVGGVAGLIGDMGSITNVTVKDCEINGNEGGGAGGVIGVISTEVVVTVSGATLLDSKVTAYNQAGGIVGIVNGLTNIENCLVQSSAGKTVTIDAINNCAGGIVGNIYWDALISGCKVINDGVFNVRAGNQYAGGIAGRVDITSDCEIVACLVSEVNVTAKNGYVGGIAGQLRGNLSNSYVYGCTTGTTPEALTGRTNIMDSYFSNSSVVTSCYYQAYNESDELVTPVPNSSGEMEPGTPVDWTTASENMNRNLTGYIWGGTYDAPTLTAL